MTEDEKMREYIGILTKAATTAREILDSSPEFFLELEQSLIYVMKAANIIVAPGEHRDRMELITKQYEDSIAAEIAIRAHSADAEDDPSDSN